MALLIHDGYLFLECQECDGFGWTPVATNSEEEEGRGEGEKGGESEPRRRICARCYGIGVVRTAIESVRIIVKKGEEADGVG